MLLQLPVYTWNFSSAQGPVSERSAHGARSILLDTMFPEPRSVRQLPAAAATTWSAHLVLSKDFNPFTCPNNYGLQNAGMCQLGQKNTRERIKKGIFVT